MKKRILQMKWTKKIVLIALLLGVAGLGKMYAYDFSAVCETGQTLYYNITDAENHYVALVYPGSADYSGWSGFTEPIGDIVLPENVQYEGNTYAVTSIGDYAFFNCSSLTGSLTIPNSVTSIGSYAFSGCSGFTGSLTIGNTVTTIGSGAFSWCSGLTGSLTIGNSVTEIGSYAFSGCSGFTGSLTIPNSVTSIGSYAFSGSSFTGSLTIPNSVATIGYGAFYGCSGFTGSLTLSNSMTTIGSYAFSFCSGFTGSLTIPNSVTSIGGSAFYNCSGFTGSLTIPNSVTTIGDNAFYGCIFNGLNVDMINIPSGFINKVRGSYSGLLTIGNSVTSIGGSAFYNCSGFTGSLTIPNSVITIGERAFSGCSGFTGSLTISNSVTSIGSYAFSGCSGFTGSLTIGNTVTTIGSGAFSWCSGLTGSLTIGNSVTEIGSYAFSGCSGLTGGLTIGNSVTEIGSYAFSSCSGLTGSLTIPNSVTTISDNAFYGCNGFTGSLTIPNSVTMIGVGAFSNCSGFTGSLTIPNSVTTIGDWAFGVCSGFTGNLTIGNSVTTIGIQAFSSCSGFTGSLIIGNSVTEIGDMAFFGCIGLTGSLTIPNSVTDLGSLAFSWCSGFTGSLTIGNSVATIGNEAFSGCSGLSSIISFPSTPPSLGDNVFYNTASDLTFFVPCGTLESYQLANGWSTLNLREMCAGEITATANPTEGGTVTGAGYYEGGTTCTMTATPVEGYLFLNWSKDGQIVSTDSIYSFIVAGDADFVANFAEEGEVCALTFDLFDSYGDGYTGNYLVVNFPDGSSQQLTVESGYSASHTLWIAHSSHITLTWIVGSYPEDCSFTVSYSNGYVIYHCENLNESFSYEFDVDCVFSPMDNIIFADTNVKAICVANWDTNGDGELSYAEAAAVTDLGQVFRGNTEITSFEELRDFVGLNSIGDYEFFNCHGLTSIEIPNSVISIGIGAFRNCSSMARMVVESGNTVYDSRGNCNSIIKTSTNELVAGCKNTIIPNSVTSIGNNAFTSCIGLTSITIPNSVTSIGYSTFSYCTYLTSITIPDPVSFIGNNAFYHCTSLTSISICNSVTYIGHDAFSDCSSLEQMLVASGNTVYDSRGNCNAIIKTSTNELVAGCKTTVIPDSVTSIGNDAFYFCSGLTSIEIPNSVISIGSLAFEGCTGLTSIEIPNSVTSIERGAFWGCSNLTDIVMLGTIPPSFGSDVYIYTNNCPIYVPYESVNDYKTTTNWSDYEDRIFPMAYTTISGYGEGEGNYRFIASPLVENTAPTAVDNMITETAYDLYRFDQSEDDEWQNYKYPENTPNFFLTNGQGYLYANAEDVNLIFKGEFNEDDTKEVGLAYDANAEFAGWNLVGNPFPVSAYASRSCYTMNEDGTGIEPNMVSSATAIPACTGVMVMAEAEGETVVFSTEAPEATTNQGCLQIAVAQTTTRGNAIQDKAIVSFNAGDRLEKFVFNKENAVISIPQGGKELAIACTDKQGEMPLNFKATKNGEYTLTIHSEAVELDYLHLIDNLAGADVDLLVTPTYTFTGKTMDYASRFRLVFSGNEADSPSTGSETFAFISNGSIVIIGAEADAVLQIVDMQGRIIVCCDAAHHVSIDGMTSGVYVLRLIEGESIRTQKIVIE